MSMLSSLLSGGPGRHVAEPGPPLPDSTVRFGRVPKREKAKILAAMQKVNADVQERALSVELEDESKLMAAIVTAHEETCEYTRDKVAPLIEEARIQSAFQQGPQQMSCPLNPPPPNGQIADSVGVVEDFSERFWPAIRGVVEFAKRIPGFSLLAQDDQVTLLKAGVFEVLLVRLSCMFDARSNAMVCLNGQFLRRDLLPAHRTRFLLDSMFDFAERVNVLNLSDNEIGIYSAVLVIAPDRPGIRNVDLVNKVQKKLTEVLSKALTLDHPDDPTLYDKLMKNIPDLRTLNQLHSEKLLAYKMEPYVLALSKTETQNNNDNNNNNDDDNNDSQDNGNHELTPEQGVAPYNDPWTAYSCHRSNSPGQNSDWSVTTDSKDGPERFGSPRSIGSEESPVRTASFSSTRSAYDEHENVRLATPPERTGHGLLRQQLSRPPKQELEHGPILSGDDTSNFYHKIRRVDSPTDSGIESGKEQGGQTPTASLCSSPHSSMEEKMSECEKEIDDMPVLKRALQAPPLINTTMLMDEAYRHHKKFRAARKECERRGPPTPTNLPRDCPVGARAPSRPSLASAHSTLVRTLEQKPAFPNEDALKHSDYIHSCIMQNEPLPVAPHPHVAASNCPNSPQAQYPQYTQSKGPQQHYYHHATSWPVSNGSPQQNQQRLIVFDPSRVMTSQPSMVMTSQPMVVTSQALVSAPMVANPTTDSQPLNLSKKVNSLIKLES